jgi:hypothetical protein
MCPKKLIFVLYNANNYLFGHCKIGQILSFVQINWTKYFNNFFYNG